jgi:hypothetical protein
MQQLQSREILVEEFAPQYEQVWNFELKAGDVDETEAAIFKEVFDAAAWYTPYEEDRESYPGFKSEAAVFGAVEHALEKLGK